MSLAPIDDVPAAAQRLGRSDETGRRTRRADRRNRVRPRRDAAPGRGDRRVHPVRRRTRHRPDGGVGEDRHHQRSSRPESRTGSCLGVGCRTRHLGRRNHQHPCRRLRETSQLHPRVPCPVDNGRRRNGPASPATRPTPSIPARCCWPAPRPSWSARCAPKCSAASPCSPRKPSTSTTTICPSSRPTVPAEAAVGPSKTTKRSRASKPAEPSETGPGSRPRRRPTDHPTEAQTKLAMALFADIGHHRPRRPHQSHHRHHRPPRRIMERPHPHRSIHRHRHPRKIQSRHRRLADRPRRQLAHHRRRQRRTADMSRHLYSTVGRRLTTPDSTSPRRRR